MESSKLWNPYKVTVKGNVSSRRNTLPPAPPFIELPSESCENNRSENNNIINNTNTDLHCQQTAGYYSPLRPAHSIHNSLNSTLGTEVVNPYKKPQHRIESNTGQNVANPYQRKRRISFQTPLVPTKINTAMQPKPKIRNPYLKKAGMTSKTSHQQHTLSVASSAVQTPAKRRQYESTDQLDQLEPTTNSVSFRLCDNPSVVQNQEMPLVNSQTTKQNNASFDYGKSWNHESPATPLAETNGRKHSVLSDPGQTHASTSHNGKLPLSNQRITSCFISSKSPFLRTRFTSDHNTNLVTPTRSPLVKSLFRKLRQATITFLIGAMKKAKNDFLVQQSKSLFDEIPQSPQYVQIYGIAISEPISTLYKSQKSFSFCLDDGTATIDVLFVDPTDVNHDDNHNRVKDNFLSSLNLPPKRVVTKGARIECRGCIRFFPSNHQDSDGIQPKLTPCYIVDSVSFATDPNFEALRTAQISYLKKNPGFAKGGSAVPQKLEDKMYVLGNPEDRAAHSEDNAESSVDVDRHRLFHLISISKPKGLSCDELGLLLSIQSAEEANALQNELKILQDSFEIYVSREGSFLPM